MTKRQSGLPPDDKPKGGITSLCNSDAGIEKRAAALILDKSIKRAQRYETATLTDLASWPAAVEYKTLPKRLQDQVLEYYIWNELRKPSMCYYSMQAAIAQSFAELQESARDTLANELCDSQNHRVHSTYSGAARIHRKPHYWRSPDTALGAISAWVTNTATAATNSDKD
jgi:hypothetical protein